MLAGHASVAEAWEMAGTHTKTLVTPDTLLYRVQFRYLAEKPNAAPSMAVSVDLQGLAVELRRMDALSQHGAWTSTTLRLIAEHPRLRAKDLMALAGRDDLVSFKRDVRKLKALGLTISHEVGYELSEIGLELLTQW